MEEGKEPIKVRLSTVILIFIVIILVGIIILLATYNGNLKLDNEKTNVQAESYKNNDDENNQANNENTDTKNLSINNNLVKELYSEIPSIGAIKFDGKNETSYSVYQNKNITMQNLDNMYILYFVAKNKLNIKYEDKQDFSAEETLDKTGGSWYSFDANILQNRIKELYGDNTNIKNQSFGYYGEEWGYKENENKYYYSVGGGGSGTGTYDVSKLISAEQKDNEIDLYSKYIAYDIVDEENQKSIALYSDITKIEKLKDCDFNEYVDNVYSNQSSDIKSTEDYILKNDENLMKTYKHVFKADKDGNYHWYSSEPVVK